MPAKSWNHNTVYHAALLRRIPRGPIRSLDIGCGDGTFAVKLAAASSTVIAIDPDDDQVALARTRCANLENIRVVQGDFMTVQLEPGSFDLITALAALHHLPFVDALERISLLLRPGGRLIVLGVWTDDVTRFDHLRNQLAGRLNRLLRRLWGPDQMCAPAVMPTLSLVEVRTQLVEILPGASIRRRLLWRYIVVWNKPG